MSATSHPSPRRDLPPRTLVHTNISNHWTQTDSPWAWIVQNSIYSRYPSFEVIRLSIIRMITMCPKCIFHDPFACVSMYACMYACICHCFGCHMNLAARMRHFTRLCLNHPCCPVLLVSPPDLFSRPCRCVVLTLGTNTQTCPKSHSGCVRKRLMSWIRNCHVLIRHGCFPTVGTPYFPTFGTQVEMIIGSVPWSADEFFQSATPVFLTCISQYGTSW